MAEKNSAPFKEEWKFNEGVTRLGALEKLGQLGVLLILALCYTVILPVVLMSVVLLPSALVFILGIIDNLVLKFIFGFKKTWLSEVVEFLANIADKAVKDWIK